MAVGEGALLSGNRGSAEPRSRSWQASGRSVYRQWKLAIEPERLRLRRCVGAWIRETSRPGVKILEVGAGTAFMEPLIRKAIPDVLYVNGDIAPTDNSTLVFDAAAMPVADGAMDVVIALEVLEHMPKPMGLLVEASRVLRPGGRLIITVPFMFGVHDLRDYYRYTPLGLKEMMAEVDVEITATSLRGGTFVASTGLLRNLILNTIVGKPEDWRARGLARQLRWLVSTVVLTPWTLVTYAAYGLDAVLDRDSVSPPGYFFLCTRLDTPSRATGRSAP